MTEELVLLECITDNAYQPRTTDNAEHIESLARSIAADGLLQKPTARHTAESAELAFGHSRRKAFEWLRVNWEKEKLPERYNNYSQMPLNFEELTDEEMYRYAVSENVQRKDLDAVEIARAMAVYRDQFGKNSDEIGALFGMNGSTVRGKLRLLDLPEQLQTKLSAGEISEGTARMLLSVQKLASTHDLFEALEYAEENPDETPAFAIEGFISRRQHVHELWSGSREGKPRTEGWKGTGWLLDMKKFPNRQLPLLNKAALVEALRIEDDPKAIKIVERYGEYVNADNAPDCDADYHTANQAQMQKQLDLLYELDPAHKERIEHLKNPTACNLCPFYAVVNGSHYCGIKTCYDRKRIAWAEHRFEKASKDLGISIYQPADGKYRVLDYYQDRPLFAKKNKDLRLLPKRDWNGNMYQSFDGVDNDIAWVVLTGETLKKRLEEKKSNKDAHLEPEEQAENVLEHAEHELKWMAAAEVARQLFEGFSAESIGLLFRAAFGWRHVSFIEGQEPTDEPQKQLLWIARAMLDRVEVDDEADLDTVSQVADSLIKTCQMLGVKLPKALTQAAAEFDAQIAAVSTATEES